MKSITEIIIIVFLFLFLFTTVSLCTFDEKEFIAQSLSQENPEELRSFLEGFFIFLKVLFLVILVVNFFSLIVYMESKTKNWAVYLVGVLEIIFGFVIFGILILATKREEFDGFNYDEEIIL